MGDLNADGAVDLADLAILQASGWMRAARAAARRPDADERVGASDLATAANWRSGGHGGDQRVHGGQFIRAVHQPAGYHTMVNGVARHDDWIEIQTRARERGFAGGWYLTDDKRISRNGISGCLCPADVTWSSMSGKTADEYRTTILSSTMRETCIPARTELGGEFWI